VAGVAPPAPDPLAGFTVGVTADQRRHEQAELFERAGAQVLLAPVTAKVAGAPGGQDSRWPLPGDSRPARGLLAAACGRRLDAVTFTSAAAVANLFALAELTGRREQLGEALNDGVVAATIGPGTTATARALGVGGPVQAAQPTLPGLAQAVVDAMGGRRHRLRVGPSELVVQGSVVRVDGERVELSGRERALLEALCRRTGAVVPRAVLVQELWAGAGTSPHTVDVTVARLRRRLGTTGGAIRTVARRGYWLDASVLRS